MGINEEKKETEKKQSVFSLVYPERSTLRKIKLDRFKREAVAEAYFTELADSIRELSKLKDQLEKDVNFVISSLELKKAAYKSEAFKAEQSRINDLKKEKEVERVKYAKIFMENHAKIQKEYERQISIIKEVRRKHHEEVREWFELRFYALNPENHPKFYLTRITRSAGLDLSKSPNFEKDVSDLESKMMEELVASNRERGRREKEIEEKFSTQLAELNRRYKAFMKEVVGKELAVIRKLNAKYSEMIESARKESVRELSVNLDSIDKFILTIRSKHDKAFHDIIRKEADLENEYRDNMMKLADLKQSIPESLASKYLYCPLKLPKQKVPEQKKEAEPVRSKLDQVAVKATGRTSQVLAGGEEPKRIKIGQIIKTAIGSLVVGGLIYFYPEITQTERDTVQKVPVQVHKQLVRGIVVSTETVKPAEAASAEKLLDEKKKVSKSEPFKGPQFANSPLISVTGSTQKADPIIEGLAKKRLIFDLNQISNIKEERFVSKGVKFSSHTIESSNASNPAQEPVKAEIAIFKKPEEKKKTEDLNVEIIEQDVSDKFERVELKAQDEAPTQEEIQSSEQIVGFGEEPVKPGKERTVIMCGDRPVYVEHDPGATLNDNDPDFCE